MSRDDEASKQERPRRPSIPAPASVPRPSRPPGTTQKAASTPPGARKGTLEGIHPSALDRIPSSPPARAAAPASGSGYGYSEPTEDEFDAEKTMVLDPDDAPTADYDPRTHAQPMAAQAVDPQRVRGASTSGVVTSASASDAPRQAATGTDLTQPVIPAAPQTPTFGTPAAARPSEIGKARRTSRRTVKIPDDQVRKRLEEMSESNPEPPTLPRGDGAADMSGDGPTPTDGAEPDGPAVSTALESMPAIAESMPAMANEPTAAGDDLIEEEITIVKALRIISIGSDPPPPITSAIATWPPPARLTFDDSLESGWTPAAPRVSATIKMQREDVLPDAASEAMQVEGRSQDLDGLDISNRISEIPYTQQDEILEEIEPDAMPFTAPAQPPKRPPPPPPKAKAETKPEAAKPEAKPEAKPASKPSESTTEAPPQPRPWWDDIFSDEYIRTMDRLDAGVIGREVDFIEESLGMEKHAVVLDLACGMGDHAVELASRGYSVVGFDHSKGMLKIAEQKVKARMKVSPGYVPPSFVQGDMRELAYEEAFDGVYCWATSFGYFDEEKNVAVLQKIHRALRVGGMFLLEVANRDYVAPRSPSLVWFEGHQCVCMDDMYVDFFTSRMRVKRTAMFEGGLSRELDYSIRLYTLHELGKVLHQTGFKVIEVTGHPAHPGVFFGTESPHLIILAERS